MMLEKVVRGCGEGDMGGILVLRGGQGHIRAPCLGAGKGGDYIRGSISRSQSGPPSPSSLLG